MTSKEARQWLYRHADHLGDTPYGASTGGRQCREIASLIAELEAQAAERGRRNAVPITEEFVDAVEGRVGMGSGAWDMVDPQEICHAAIAEFQKRALTPPDHESRKGPQHE